MATRRHRFAPSLGVWILLVCSSLGAGCASGEAPGGEVVLYTSMPTDVVDRLEGVIERRFPDLEGDYWLANLDSEGIRLTVFRGRTADIQRVIADEIESGGIKADLVWLAEPSPYELYEEMGLLAPYEPPQDALIPPSYVDSDGYYVAGRLISMVLAWNTTLWPEGLSDWPELDQPASTAFPAPASGAARATIKALQDKYGPDFFRTLAEAGMVSVPSNGAARDAVAEGTVAAVGVLDYMARDAKEAGLPIDFAYPAGGTLVIPSPIAITATARNPEAAEAVVDFILSERGQQIIVEIGNFYPARSDVAPPQGAPPVGDIPALSIDWSELASQIDTIGATWETLFGAARKPASQTSGSHLMPGATHAP